MDDGTTQRSHRITADCPVRCLRLLVSARAFNPLVHVYDPPRTVGDVVSLYQEGKLADFRNLGAISLREIAVALDIVGLITEHDSFPDTSRRPVRRRSRKGRR
jgi:hypothetical protein